MSARHERGLIIFDMDGVLVDVGMSYREVVRMSVFLYLRDVIGARLEDDAFITRRDVSVIKKRGGLNNDWDLTGCIINTVLRSMVDPHVKAGGEWKRALEAPCDDSEALRLARELARKAGGGGLAQVPSRLREEPLHRLYERQRPGGGERSPLLLDRGDVGSGNLVKRIFQELYLGGELFTRTYGEEPLVYHGAGYIEREELIPSTEQLEHLARRQRLGIATGRPRPEAEYALERFELTRFFPVMVSEDDVAGEEARRGERLRKPHPYSLLVCMERSGYTAGGTADGRGFADRCMYVGDMPDDMIVARRAGVLPVGFVNDRADESPPEREEHRLILEQNGAVQVVGNFRELIELAGDRWP